MQISKHLLLLKGEIFMNNYIVYIHKNKLNGKVYIGQTSQKPEKRWNNGRGYETSPRFFNAILKYGWDNFEHIIIKQNLSLKEANDLETKLIKQYNSQNDKYGYNITSGGQNFSHSEETKKKIGKANSKALKGKTHSSNWSKIMSKKFSGQKNPFYGKHHSEETKKKISQNRKGKAVGKDHPMYGKKHSKETLDKMSKNRQGKGGKKILCINTGKIFNCMMDAARWCGLKNASSISRCCLGKSLTAGKHPETQEKLKWRYVNE